METAANLEVLIGNAQDGRSLEILAELAEKEAAELAELAEGYEGETLRPDDRKVVVGWKVRSTHYTLIAAKAWAKREKIIKEG